jgi:hypothetical protein
MRSDGWRRHWMLIAGVLFGAAAVARMVLGIGSPAYAKALAAAGIILVGLGLFFGRLTRVGRTLAGSMCAACARRIVFEHEGDFCDACGAACHGDCLPTHRGDMHKTGTGGPFR